MVFSYPVECPINNSDAYIDYTWSCIYTGISRLFIPIKPATLMK